MFSAVGVSGAALDATVPSAAVPKWANYTYMDAVSVVNIIAAVIIATLIFYAVAVEEACDVSCG